MVSIDTVRIKQPPGRTSHLQVCALGLHLPLGTLLHRVTPRYIQRLEISANRWPPLLVLMAVCTETSTNPRTPYFHFLRRRTHAVSSLNVAADALEQLRPVATLKPWMVWQCYEGLTQVAASAETALLRRTLDRLPSPLDWP
jgi:hypothetical protein